jgi:hypothetical protein
MTKHPLTDEIILSIADEAYHLPGYQDDMRAAADWQLEQVIEWLKSELGRLHYMIGVSYLDHEIDVDYALDDLKEAMRPQEDN